MAVEIVFPVIGSQLAFPALQFKGCFPYTVGVRADHCAKTAAVGSILLGGIISQHHILHFSIRPRDYEVCQNSAIINYARFHPIPIFNPVSVNFFSAKFAKKLFCYSHLIFPPFLPMPAGALPRQCIPGLPPQERRWRSWWF